MLPTSKIKETRDVMLETMEHFLLYLLLLMGSIKRQQFLARWLKPELETIRVSLHLGKLWQGTAVCRKRICTVASSPLPPCMPVTVSPRGKTFA